MPLHAKGADVESLSFYTDWRAVNGLLIPFASEERNVKTDAVMNVLQWTRIDLDVEVRDEAFRAPH